MSTNTAKRPSPYMPQFFSDVTEIRKNMTGVTGSGELHQSWPIGNNDFRTYEEYLEWASKIEREVEELNNKAATAA